MVSLRGLRDIVNGCIVGEGKFKEGDKCRPSTCPFKSIGACKYLNGCLDEGVKDEFRMAGADVLKN